jgi:acetyl-CoA synthetase
VAEAAVIPVKDKIRGEVAKAFVVLNEGAEEGPELVKELKEHIRRELGPVAVVKAVEFRRELPKTRSGKILRRILKAEETGEAAGDVSTLED